MKKRILSGILCAMMAASLLVGCGGSSDGGSGDAAKTEESSGGGGADFLPLRFQGADVDIVALFSVPGVGRFLVLTDRHSKTSFSRCMGIIARFNVVFNRVFACLRCGQNRKHICPPSPTGYSGAAGAGAVASWGSSG